MFQCHSPISFCPYPLPQSPKDCSIYICVSFAVSHTGLSFLIWRVITGLCISSLEKCLPRVFAHLKKNFFCFLESHVVLVVKNQSANAGDIRDRSSIPGLGRFPWRMAQQPTPVLLPGESHVQRRLVATVHRVAVSWTRLKLLISTQHFFLHVLYTSPLLDYIIYKYFIPFCELSFHFLT